MNQHPVAVSVSRANWLQWLHTELVGANHIYIYIYIEYINYIYTNQNFTVRIKRDRQTQTETVRQTQTQSEGERQITHLKVCKLSQGWAPSSLSTSQWCPLPLRVVHHNLKKSVIVRYKTVYTQKHYTNIVKNICSSWSPSAQLSLSATGRVLAVPSLHGSW